VYAVLNRKQNLRSTYCSEANDRHEASRGLFATAELLVFLVVLSLAVSGLPLQSTAWIDSFVYYVSSAEWDHRLLGHLIQSHVA